MNNKFRYFIKTIITLGIFFSSPGYSLTMTEANTALAAAQTAMDNNSNSGASCTYWYGTQYRAGFIAGQYHTCGPLMVAYETALRNLEDARAALRALADRKSAAVSQCAGGVCPPPTRGNKFNTNPRSSVTGGYTISGTQIISGTVGAEQLASGAVTNTKIADNAITTGKITDNAITTGKITDSAITTGKISGSATLSGSQIVGAVANATNAQNLTGTVSADQVRCESTYYKYHWIGKAIQWYQGGDTSCGAAFVTGLCQKNTYTVKVTVNINTGNCGGGRCSVGVQFDGASIGGNWAQYQNNVNLPTLYKYNNLFGFGISIPAPNISVGGSDRVDINYCVIEIY